MTGFGAPPDGLHQRSNVITVPLGTFKRSDFRCPAADALKARGYRVRRPAYGTKEELEHFALGPFMAALDHEVPDRAEGEGPRRRPTAVHDGLRQWTVHAVAMYRDAFAPDPDRPLVEQPSPWVYRHQPASPDHRGAREYRISVWGRCLRSEDGTQRELRLPVNRLSSTDPDPGHVAAAALVLAEGGPGPLPDRLRIVEFALFDGSVRVLFEGTRPQALALYRTHGAKALSALLDTQDYRPGSGCAECPFQSVCPALRKAPGLLGISGTGRPRRSWSVTNGRNYRACPARDHFRRLRLPTADAVERSSAAERGRAVHAYLAQQHGSGPLRTCTDDVPEDWVPDTYALGPQERTLGRLLLQRHAVVCPMRFAGDRTDVRAEARVVRHDTAADVVVIAAPDLLYRDGGSWVWRETKTSASNYRAADDLLVRHPQLALGVLLLARGDLGGTRARARVELEVLRPDGADLEIIDPFVPAVRSSAEQIVASLVTDWYRDDAFRAAPGTECSRCEVARWCPANAAGAGAPTQRAAQEVLA
ncbi:PD-(D/E)XK nuclease family protein [Streptomyces sp. NPDC051555]|uniref:PD-(D/E)XK nuclease family protein n=1 Tax=Streptomyces sp. NPDC051555 TaxID=3365657 RepID=UPI0037B4C195